MTTPSELLVSAVEEKRPIVLILGQDAWADPLGGNSILLQALNKLGRVDQCQRGWSGLLDIQRVPEEFYEWLAERFQRRVPPSEIETLSELPWSAIFTSSVDPTLPRLLEATGRHPSVVLTAEESPPVVRSRSRPPLYYLFSRAGEHDIRALPPANRAELNTRRIQHALQLLTRVSETATTLGVVLVVVLRRLCGLGRVVVVVVMVLLLSLCKWASAGAHRWKYLAILRAVSLSRWSPRPSMVLMMVSSQSSSAKVGFSMASRTAAGMEAHRSRSSINPPWLAVETLQTPSASSSTSWGDPPGCVNSRSCHFVSSLS